MAHARRLARGEVSWILRKEDVWLRHRVRRLRAALRIAKEPRVEAILRELIN